MNNNNNNNNLYNKDSIESLSPLAFVRLRPGIYCGSTEYSTQLLIEIVSNGVDEWALGHGSCINISIDKNNVITVTDEGQGFILNSFREDNKSILEAAFSVFNTSAKYTNDGVYEGTSLGLNGIGCKLATYLSSWLEVISWRDGKYEQVRFKEGEFEKREIGDWTDETRPSGTSVTWLPSKEFFTHQEVEIGVVNNLLKVISCLCAGLTIKLNVDGKETVYISKNGLNDLVDEVVKDKEIIKNRLNCNFTDGKYKLNMVMTYTSDYSSVIIPYVNTGLTDGGPHITQIKTLITRKMNEFFREKGWLKDKDENLSGDDCQEGMYLVFDIIAPNVAYDSQIKSRITKIDMKPFTSALAEELQYWLLTNEKDIRKIADKALVARKAREAAKKARETARGIKQKKDKIIKFDTKLSDCYSKDRKKCEIMIVEGDSASGNLKKARNNEFQAVLPIRGKLLNTQKASLEKIQKNMEIISMIQAFGLDIDIKNMKVTYLPEKLRYGKIIILSDGDVDGRHIKNLFYTFVWNFCPELILDGYVYAGIPPLYRTIKKKKYIYLKDDEALAIFKSENQGASYEVAHFKGLGEMDLDETEDTLINPQNRIIRQVTVNDVELANKLFDDLMGTSSENRKQYIISHAKEAEVNA